MDEFGQLLDEESIGSLRAALGARLSTAFAPSLQADSPWTFAPAVSIGLASGFLALESKAAETPDHLITYHRLVARFNSEPVRVARVKVADHLTAFGPNASSYSLAGKAPISQIGVCTRRDEGPREVAIYDVAIVFFRDSRPSFAIRCPELTMSGVLLTRDSLAMESLLREFPIRIWLETGPRASEPIS